MRTNCKAFLPGKVEVRDVGGKEYFIGTPVVYDSPSELIYGCFREYIKPGAFDEHLNTNPDILCLRDHNPDKLLGRTSSGTLKITRDATGLHIECERPNTTYALDLAEQIRRGDINGMSFGFDVTDDEWYMADAIRTRDVIKGKVFEFSYVTLPAYKGSVADIRSMQTEIDANIARKDRVRSLRNKLRLWAIS